jgi:hypothetical protein
MSTTKELIERASSIEQAKAISAKSNFPWPDAAILRVFNRTHASSAQAPVAKFVPSLRSVGAVQFVFTPRKGDAKAVKGIAVVTERESPRAKGDVKVVYDLLTKKNGTVTLSHKVYTRSLEGASGMAVVDGVGMCHIEIAAVK